MKRREFLRTAGGAAGAAGAAATPATARRSLPAQQDDETDGDEEGADGEQADGADGEDADEGGAEDGGNETEGDGGGGATETVTVGPGGELEFDPETIAVQPGTTVVWEWDSDNHNVVVESAPEASDWEGQPAEETFDTGYVYEHTFEVEGTYEYFCQPHRSAGMVGTVEVSQDAGGAGGYEPPDPAHMGIPIQKHFVGAMAFMSIFVTLVFTFYVLKYGESAHTSAPSKRD